MIRIYNKNDKYSLKVKENIVNILNSKKILISEFSYSIVITIGGDGTFIEAVNKEINNIDKIKFIPINTGTLGFYSEKCEDFVNIIDEIYTDNFDEYSLLKASTKNHIYYAINEFNINSLSKTLIIDYYIDGEWLQTLRGSGIIVSTSQGSTAMSKSNGGSVIYPNTNTYQVTELSSINNNSYRTLNSSIVLSKDTRFEIHIRNIQYAVFNYDCFYNLPIEELIKFTLSNKKIKVIHKKKNTFTKRIIHGFIK